MIPLPACSNGALVEGLFALEMWQEKQGIVARCADTFESRGSFYNPAILRGYI